MPNPCGASSRHGPSEAIGPLHVGRPVRFCYQFHHPQPMLLPAYAPLPRGPVRTRTSSPSVPFPVAGLPHDVSQLTGRGVSCRASTVADGGGWRAAAG